ncbi:MAG: cysteine--tRNA ligase [Candidatus Paceibacterota bacterium]
MNASESKLSLYNTMSRSVEPFEPLNADGSVGMYNCGPTVYNYQHIGNLRAYVFADILRRTLEADGHEVKQIINITDVGHLVSDGDTGQDKMTKGLKREGLPITLSGMKELGEKYATIFREDLDKLNIQKPAAYPKASAYIDEDIALVEILESKGFTYETDDGIYFDTSRLDDYGKLAGAQLADDDDTQTRVENDQKRNQRDFALWKFDNKLGWDSPWGQGFPGWHIECSVMSMQHLGESFDIHTGGIDHINVHHTNEIAQSEAATEKEMARFWLHNNFIKIAGEKISKSIGNTLYLSDLVDQGYDPLSYRYLLLGARYRTKMNFSWEALDGAQSALGRLHNFMRSTNHAAGDVINSYKADFMAAMHDDLNTPEALAVIWKLLDNETIQDTDKAATIADFDRILGLDITSSPEINIPAEVKKLADEREEARSAGNYQLGDELREKIEAKGFQVNDADDGFHITLLSKK